MQERSSAWHFRNKIPCRRGHGMICGVIHGEIPSWTVIYVKTKILVNKTKPALPSTFTTGAFDRTK
jgi:hypothetical protein